MTEDLEKEVQRDADLQDLKGNWTAISFPNIVWLQILISMANSILAMLQHRKLLGSEAAPRIAEMVDLMTRVQEQLGFDDATMMRYMRQFTTIKREVSKFSDLLAGFSPSEN